MTENEAIKNVTAYVYMECENMPQQVIKALDIMKDCTKEIQQYRAIGTSDECRVAVERMKPKKWIAEDMGEGEVAWKCPACKEYWALMDGTPQDNEYNFCPKCGQALVEMKDGTE